MHYLVNERENIMRIETIKEKCTGCGACVSQCPKGCISFFIDDEGFYYPKIDKEECISCGKCEQSCHCINLSPIEYKKVSYYGFSLNPQIRSNSTSGGVFFSLANNVVNKKGKVYGAAFDYESLYLKHTSTDYVSLNELQKSKYIESFMGHTIADIKKDLINKKQVLFCGTPCQAAAVRHIFGNNSNLIICDFICHGVPSSEIFKNYILKKLHNNEKLINIDFRPKEFGWSSKNIQLVIKTSTSTSTSTIPYYLDIFYKGFMTENAFLRKSCYFFQYRQKHYSDITIADFWGYRDFDIDLNDEKGLSLIVANTDKGNTLINGLQDFELHKIDNKFSEYAFMHKDYTSFMENRKQFYKEYKNNDLKSAALKTYMKDYYINWLKYYVKKILKRV